MGFRPPAQQHVTPQGKGRFPGFDVLDQMDHQDDVTTGVVLARLNPLDQLAFFTTREQAVATMLVDLLLDQQEAPKIPVLPMIDARLASGETDGFSYEGMPEDGQAWRDSLAGLDADAQDRFGQGFAELDQAEQGRLIDAVQQHQGNWHELPASRVWSLWTRYACAAFYSHPWAWNEIGFGGPAYPRGYKATGVNAREGWEVRDVEPVDPVAASARLERARAEHQRSTGHRGNTGTSS